MPLNPLSVFYRVPMWKLVFEQGLPRIKISWRCDPEAVSQIARAGNSEITGISLVDLSAVNAYFDRLLLTDCQLTNLVVTNLYRLAATDANPVGHNCWFNFITAMTFKAALHTWQKVPKYQQSEELFERLTTPILNLRQLLDRFDPEYDPNLLVGLQAWTYRVAAYNSFAYVRKHGDPYFRLSNLGVVSRSSWLTIRTATIGNIGSDRIDPYLTVCKLFKTYLERKKIRVNNLELHHWQEICVEISLKSIEITSDELRSTIERIGGWIRAQANPIVEKYDPNLFTSLEGSAELLEPDFTDSNAHLRQIFALLGQFIGGLPAPTRELVELRHQRQLNQVSIAKMMSIDQSQVSRQLGKIYLNLLDLMHSQIHRPDGIKLQKNSLAIATARSLIDKYFLVKISPS